MEKMKEMSPSALDLEIRSLSLLNDFYEFKVFLTFLESELSKNKNFELVQAFLNVFLTVIN